MAGNLRDHKHIESAALFTADVWEHVCPVVRIIRPLQQAGIEVLHGASWVSGRLKCDIEQIQHADIVVVQRNFPHHFDEFQAVLKETRRQQKKVIYDLDDLLFALPITHPDYRFYRHTRAALVQAIVQVDMITCSTERLAEQVARFNTNVRVLPNCLDDKFWDLGRFSSETSPNDEPQFSDISLDRPLVVGYCGSHSHQQDIEMIAPVLKSLVDEYKGKIQLKFWGLAPPPILINLHDVEYDRTMFLHYEKFVDYFRTQQVDIFVAPLIQNDFNECKSHLKYLEYSALGVPGVFSDVLPYRIIVKPAENGFLAATLHDWENHLRQLIEEPSLRIAVGRNARNTVERDWLLSANAENWSTCYEDVRISTGHTATQESARSIAAQFVAWHKELEQEISELRQSVRNNEELLHQLQQQAIQQEHELNQLRNYAAMVEGSIGWRMVQSLTPLRYKLIPTDSIREQAFQQLVRIAHLARTQGIASAYAGFRSVIEAYRQYGQLYEPITPKEEVLVSNGKLCPSPAITVLYIAYQRSEVSIEQIQRWLAMQTWQDVDLVTWVPLQEEENVMGEAATSSLYSHENGWQSLVAGRYLCVASLDLLAQPATYLEENLMALEAQKLAFTLNIDQQSELMTTMLRLYRLPGSDAYPLLRTIARKECVTKGFAIDLDKWEPTRVEEELPALVAKVLIRTTNHIDVPREIPFKNKLFGTGLTIEQNSLLVHSTSVANALMDSVYSSVSSVLKTATVTHKQPTVLVIMSILAVGGAERVHQYLLEHLHDEVAFILATLEQHDGRTGTTTDQFRTLTPWVYNLQDFLHPALRFSALQYLIERHKPETLYIANGCSWIFDNLARIKECYPMLRIAAQVYDHQAGWINRYSSEVVATIDAHIGTNRQICNAYVARGAAANKVHLIEHCVDLNEYSPMRFNVESRQRIRQQLGVKDNRRIVTFMARLHPQKRPMDFVEMARRFMNDESVTCLLIGDGPLSQAVDQEITRIGIKNIIRRTFYRPSSEIFAVSDVYVLPSEYEGMPLVILEAQAMGVPVVVTDVGNNREVVEVTQGGVVINNIGDAGGLYHGVQQLLQNPPDPAKIRQAVKDQLSQKFGILPEQMAARYKKVLLAPPHSEPIDSISRI